jgi:tetratricopeptide (TPR) repeat protein
MAVRDSLQCPLAVIGQRLGPYAVEAELGSGGMGTVYRAAGPAGTIALKVIHPHLLATPGFFKRFLREAEIGKSVRHDNVVRVYDCDATEADGKAAHFLVMEYVEGQTLRELLADVGRVPEELCRHVGREVAKGLAAIHEAGVVHRDLKPENVMITQEHVVKLMDLGVARLRDEAVRLSRAGDFVGSLEYAAPEQFLSGDAEPDGRADLYALGVLLYELSTGTHPCHDENPSRVIRRILDEEPRRAGAVNPQLSPFLEEVVHTLLAKDRESRFTSAAHLASVLDEGEKGGWWKNRARELRLETKRPLRRIRVPRGTALYGRDDDLALLRGLFGKAKAGDGQVLLIEGEAGIGKTRLVDDFVGELRDADEGVSFLFGSYPPGGAATAAGAFVEAYREQFGVEGLEETLRDYLATTPILIPAFSAVLRGEAPPTGAQALTKDSLQTVFVQATRGLAAERPTIILIDDLHFAPEEGRALFSSLAMAVPGHRVLLLGTTRPGAAEGWVAGVQRLDHASRTVLSRLGPKDLFRLLQDSFRSDRVANELAGRIAVKSDGNPFFVFEMIRGLRDARLISMQPDGTWVTTREIGDIQVPSSVLDLIRARLQDLSEEERELLDVASCCGFEFAPAIVADAVGMQRIPALRALGRVESRHRLVRSTGRRYAFDHHQVQEALYGGLHDELREEYHAAIAAALETREGSAGTGSANPDGALCVDLCEHYLKGARGDQALRHLDAALDHLERGFRNDQAIALTDRALEAPSLLVGKPRLEMLLRKDGRLFLLGRRDAQEDVIRQARGLAEEMGDKGCLAKVESAAGRLRAITARYEEARVHFERSLAISREIGDREGEARSTGNVANLFWRLGRCEEARAHYERSLAISLEIGDREGEARSTGNLANLYSDLGRYQDTLAYNERVLVLFREIGDRRGEAIVTSNLGLVSSDLGRHEEAQVYYERSLALCREIGDRHIEGMATGNLGATFEGLGRHEEARSHHERRLAISREIGDREGEATASGNLGIAFLHLGRYEEARVHDERYLAVSREIGFRQGEAIARANLGELSRTLGRPVEARRELEGCLALASDIGYRRVQGRALQGLARLAEAEGDAEAATALFEEALALRRALGARQQVAETLVALGALEVDRARREPAAAHLGEALALAREAKTPAAILLATVALARLARGDVRSARAALEEHEPRTNHEGRMEARFRIWELTKDRAHLEEAHRLISFARDHAPENCRDSMIEHVPLHRRIMNAWEEHRETETR